jgi:hypothetical protein
MTPLDTYNPAGLRKAGTFHSPSSANSDLCDPIVNFAFIPKRSSTSSEDLEELLNDAGVRRVAGIIEQFDRTFAGEHPSSPEGRILSDPDVLPIPTGFIPDKRSASPDAMDIDNSKESTSDHHHCSDSGLGSSVSSRKGKTSESAIPAVRPLTEIYKDDRISTVSSRRSITSGVSAITRSFSTLGSRDPGHCLGKNAIRQIQERIIKPILAEKALKDFHPLIADVPHRIGTKDITNLRDLEKTLIFLAPVSHIPSNDFESAIAHCIFRNLKDYSASPALYLDFCERSIQCIHTTVEYLCERDQRLPADRPYTNNYFLDLIEQIRRYASIMAATRQKQENGEELDEMDYSAYVLPFPNMTCTKAPALSAFSIIVPQPYHDSQSPLTLGCLYNLTDSCSSGEQVTLRGGLSENGRPMELVREKSGKTIPIVDGDMADPDVTKAFNSSKRSHDDDEDLDDDALRSMARRRKSEKPGDVIHTCKDCNKDFKRPCDLTKHQKTHSRPFKCTNEKCKYYELGWPTEKERDRHYMDKHSAAPPQYPCQYEGCSYISKRESNCKQHMEKTHGYVYVRSKSNGRNKKATGSSMQSPATPLTPFNGTPAVQTLMTPETPFADFNFNFGAFAPVPEMVNGFRRDSTTTAGTAMSYSSGFSPQQAVNHNFEEAITPEDANINHDVLFDAYGAFTTAGLQQPTPALSTGYDSFAGPSSHRPTPNVQANDGIPHLSPGAQPDVMFNMGGNTQLDEGLGFDVDQMGHTVGDFTLFGSNPPADYNLFDNMHSNYEDHANYDFLGQNSNFNDIMH